MASPFFLTRQHLIDRENLILSPYAAKNSISAGRAFPEPTDPWRTDFQRDRDRIIHCKAFRRLKGKTQVFIAHYGDHYRSRLTHTMEVAQLARDIARTMALNEDLAEAIALAHDLGHTPFGHAGEQALNDCMHRYGGRFEHNEQSRRIVEILERKSADFLGLNLTAEVLEGLGKHRSAYDRPIDIDSAELPSLEAQIVNLSDEIAYQNHDLDDGLRSGLFSIDDLSRLDLWNRASEGVSPLLDYDLTVSTTVRNLISLMVSDVITESEKRISAAKIGSFEEIRAHREPLIAFSDDFSQHNAFLRQFLMHEMYRQPEVMAMSEFGQGVIKQLFFAFTKQPNLLPPDIFARIGNENGVIVIRDYIAGMTDRYAENALSDLERRIG